MDNTHRPHIFYLTICKKPLARYLTDLLKEEVTWAKAHLYTTQEERGNIIILVISSSFGVSQLSAQQTKPESVARTPFAV